MLQMRSSVFAFLLTLSHAFAGGVIFIHPDGAGVAHWQMARFFWAGPDNELNWDRLPHVAVYRGHLSDSLTATSNGGGTVHAYGVKVPTGAFGTGESGQRPKSASGFEGSIMHEAMARGVRVGIVNSGSLIEPGTATFLASVSKRDDFAAITEQLIDSGADVILGGGEEWFLPEGVSGRHAKTGLRKDGKNLITLAEEKGYTLVFTREELAGLPSDTKKVLGLFAAEDTYNDMGEEVMKSMEIRPYLEQAPTVAEMTTAALRIFGDSKFLLVVEEEGTDNFGNFNNARGTLEALKRADDALGVGLEFIKNNPDSLLLTAADSVAGDPDAIGFPETPEKLAIAKNSRDRNAAPYSTDLDGKPFLSQPDRAGKRHPFLITWGTLLDGSGGIVARAAGRNAGKVAGSFDNTMVFSLIHETLFGEQ